MKKVYVIKIPESTRARPALEKLVEKYGGCGFSITGTMDGIYVTDHPFVTKPYEVQFVGNIKSPTYLPYMIVRCKWRGRKNKKDEIIDELLNFAKKRTENVSLILSGDGEILTFLKGSRQMISDMIDEIHEITPIVESHFILREFGSLEKLLYSD